MQLQVFQAVRLEYAQNPAITVNVDGSQVDTRTLPTQSTFKGRRVTLPVNVTGYIPHLESTSTRLQNFQFDALPIESFSQQQLFHYFDVGFRGSGTLTPRIYLDGTIQAQNFNTSTSEATETIRVYFDALAYGYIPHIHNTGTSTADAEILWARPVALPPRFYRGIRTHAEFQITFKGDVTVQWYLDGTSIGTYSFSSTNTTTEKAYFPSGTIGHVLQYTHTNPASGGKIYIVETDVTLADLEQQGMRPQPEEQ
jgi:hypothetical protein